MTALLAIAALTQVTFHFRYRFALEIGEAVIHDLRQEIFSHLQRMPMSFFQRTKTGRLISRMTSDCEAMRVGVQDVLFVGIVGLGRIGSRVAKRLQGWDANVTPTTPTSRRRRRRCWA
mgnify:CR=1 FL=1